MSKTLTATELTRHESVTAATQCLADGTDRVAAAVASGRPLSPEEHDAIAGLSMAVNYLAGRLEEKDQ